MGTLPTALAASGGSQGTLPTALAVTGGHPSALAAIGGGHGGRLTSDRHSRPTQRSGRQWRRPWHTIDRSGRHWRPSFCSGCQWRQFWTEAGANRQILVCLADQHPLTLRK